MLNTGPAKMRAFSSLLADSVYWSCFVIPNRISTHSFRVATRIVGALLVVAVVRTTGSYFDFFSRDLWGVHAWVSLEVDSVDLSASTWNFVLGGTETRGSALRACGMFKQLCG